MKESFPSKVLLFGEYSVIKTSHALAIPYELFEGSLSFKREREGGRDPELLAMVRYLKQLETHGQLNFPFDVTSFEFDVGQGLHFSSTIPQGFGVGSSGALVAALYHRYGGPVKEDEQGIRLLKDRFALLESHFHGSSSGFDPLVSYLRKPILKNNGKGLGFVTIPEFPGDGPGALFLLNTGRSRKTEPLVNLFLEKCKSQDFDQLCRDTLAPITNHCISFFLNGQKEELWNSFCQLSHFQYDHLDPMIPKLFLDLWQEGLAHKDFLLKLCGAGGGGFLLGMTKDLKKATRDLSHHEIRPLIRF